MFISSWSMVVKTLEIRIAFALLGLCIAASAAARNVSLDIPQIITTDAVTNGPSSALRSASFLRDHRLDTSGSPGTSAGLRRQLQRHFDVVLAALSVDFDRSLDVALARLQRARGQSWSAAERSVWRHTLANRRLVNMQRLRLYQLRGVFPQNEGQADHAVPIFVDNYDTACAVGHLMRDSGWTDEVAAIQRANNLVYVSDVHAGPLVDWVLISGLTQEEAALIQPAYQPPGFDNVMSNLVTGGSIEKLGLRFDNFSFLIGAYLFDDFFAPSSSDLSQVGAGVHQGVYSAWMFSDLDPVFDPWVFIGGTFNPLLYTNSSSSGGLIALAVRYRFDVTAIEPQARIVGASMENSSLYNFNFPSGIDSSIVYETRITTASSPSTTLAELESVSTTFLSNFQVSGTFAPQQKIRVHAEARLDGDGQFTSLIHSFNLVPEPAAATLAVMPLAFLAIRRRRS
jgi:hypothetical protein